jgi:hypothetical protein
MFRFHTGSCYKRRYAGQKVRHERAALGLAEDAENALQARMPEERVIIALFRMQEKTLYSRRPLKPAVRPQEFAAGQTFHPVDPPLEPQDGRPPSLRPNPQDEPDNAKKLLLSYLSAEYLTLYRRNVWHVNHGAFLLVTAACLNSRGHRPLVRIH